VGRGAPRRQAGEVSPESPAADARPAEPEATAAPQQEDRFVAAAGPGRLDAALESGLRSARSRLIEAGSEAALQQVDGAAAGDPGWTPAGRGLLKDELKLRLDETLPGGAVPAGPPAPGGQGWSVSPILKPVPRLTLDPQRGPLEGAGLRAGLEARGPELKLRGELNAQVDQPLTDPRLGSVGGELGFDYGRRSAFVPGDRLGISGKAGLTRTFGPDGNVTGAGAQVGATYLARGVLAPGDALSVSAGAFFRNNDLSGASAPQYGVNASVAYHF
jgi:hypothetical protein